MTLPSPAPRRIRLSVMGIVTCAFLISLVSAMLLGPPVSFLVHDEDQATLFQRGVLTHFTLTASITRGGQHIINYDFDAPEATGGAQLRMSGRSAVSDKDFAIFADPEKRFVLYDPANPENAIPVTSRSALAERRAFDREFAIWFYPASATIAILLSAFGVRVLRRKFLLLRFGVAATPVVTRCGKSGLGWPRVEFQFTDANGRLWDGRLGFNFPIGIGGDFAPFVSGATVFYDPDDPRIYELFLPRLALFRFVES